jgi:hypothetical protein
VISLYLILQIWKNSLLKFQIGGTKHKHAITCVLCVRHQNFLASVRWFTGTSLQAHPKSAPPIAALPSQADDLYRVITLKSNTNTTHAHFAQILTLHLHFFLRPLWKFRINHLKNTFISSCTHNAPHYRPSPPTSRSTYSHHQFTRPLCHFGFKVGCFKLARGADSRTATHHAWMAMPLRWSRKATLRAV